ncbi:Rieske (2Fe-2S) protein [Streptomyces sp. NPDC051133]|uniref:Rieske (2Fe-2S) protein n=1 Tax=Streptomyces sp. NPDC051133 TaxID=3155521 RepID=UPI0034229E7C
MSKSARRRTVLVTGAVALTVPVVGCGGKTGGGSEQTQPKTEPETAKTRTGSELTSTADIPEGGGKIFKTQKVVVTQPKKGDFKAFSAICTHEGCTLAKVADGTIDCPCHGSRFHIADGSVAHGPATRPLPQKSIEVEGKSIRLV